MTCHRRRATQPAKCLPCRSKQGLMWLIALQLTSTLAWRRRRSHKLVVCMLHCGAHPPIPASSDQPNQERQCLYQACCLRLMLFAARHEMLPLLACRGDAAPSTSTDKSKAVSNDQRLLQEVASLACQARQDSAAPSQMPFAFRQAIPGVQGPAAVQLTPVLPEKQQLTPAKGIPADTAMQVGSRQQSLPMSAEPPARSQLMTSAADSPYCTNKQDTQQTGPALMRLSQLAVTPAAQVDGRKQDPWQPMKTPRQWWGEEPPRTGGRSGSNSRHSRSSSEDQRGRRLAADLPAPIRRSATAPAQLLLESQRGSNSPKKPVPKCSAQPGALPEPLYSATATIVFVCMVWLGQLDIPQTVT